MQCEGVYINLLSLKGRQLTGKYGDGESGIPALCSDAVLMWLRAVMLMVVGDNGKLPWFRFILPPPAGDRLVARPMKTKLRRMFTNYQSMPISYNIGRLSPHPCRAAISGDTGDLPYSSLISV